MSCERRRGGRGRKEGGLRGFLLVFSFERPRGCCEGGKKTKNQPKRKTRKIQLHSGVGNIYEFKDGEEGADGAAAGADGEALRALIGSNWIDPPKRERKRVATYNESDYYRQAMKLGGGGGGGPRASAAPRLPKMPALQDFQFYDVKRITALYEKEAAYETHRHSLAEKERSARAQGASEEVVQAQIAPGPDDPQPLSEEETAEREALLASGFANWNRRDFGAFIRACEKVSWRSDGDGGRAESAFSFIEKEGKRKRKLNLSPSFPRFSHSNSNKKTKTLQYGRDDPVRIASEIEGKTEAEKKEEEEGGGAKAGGGGGPGKKGGGGSRATSVAPEEDDDDGKEAKRPRSASAADADDAAAAADDDAPAPMAVDVAKEQVAA